MKLIHLGDLHLGKSLGDFDLFEDQEYILNRILEIVDRESVDAVLIAGDVYDKSIPSEAATRLLDSFLSSLASKSVNTYMITKQCIVEMLFPQLSLHCLEWSR